LSHKIGRRWVGICHGQFYLVYVCGQSYGFSPARTTLNLGLCLNKANF
jgi:hypothetical protein